MKAHHIDTHLLVPRSKSSAKVKVKYQGHVSQKMDVSGALVFHKHIWFPFFTKLFTFSLTNVRINVTNSTKQQIFRHVSIESICRQPKKCDSKIEICCGKSRQHCWKSRKCCLLAFSAFPTVFCTLSTGEIMIYQHLICSLKIL